MREGGTVDRAEHRVEGLGERVLEVVDSLGRFTRLAGATLRARLLSTCTAREETGQALPRVLSEGLVRPVRFVEVAERLRDEGARRFVVAAPSRTVHSLLRRVLGRGAEILRADDPASVAATAARLGVG